MADIMNTHFSSVGSILGEAHGEIEFDHFMLGAAHIYNNSEIDHLTVHALLIDLCPSKSCGIDGLTARLLKDAGASIVSPLTHIFNVSLRMSVFPDARKGALVSPLYEEGPRDEPSNYRPISLLSIISIIIYLHH